MLLLLLLSLSFAVVGNSWGLEGPRKIERSDGHHRNSCGHYESREAAKPIYLKIIPVLYYSTKRIFIS